MVWCGAMYLSNFQNELSATPVPQEVGLNWLAEQHSRRSPIEKETLLKMLNRFGCGPSQIRQRRTWLPEFLNANEPGLFPTSPQSEQPSMEERSDVFQRQMGLALKNLYAQKSLAPNYLLHVTCTGYASPSVAQELVIEKKWPTAVQHLYHMGCYAAIPAVRTAQGLLAIEKKSLIEILHTEFCTLHFNMHTTAPEQLVVQSLFADGCIRYQATHEKPNDVPSLKVLATHEQILADSSADMTWNLANFGFAMTLSREVPQKIVQHIKPFLEHLFSKASLSLSEISNLTAAIHPGGPKIIDAVKNVLELKEEQIATSRKVLFENGNMSSATVPFIWKDVLENHKAASSPYVLSLAFGPGLTIAGSLLCWQA